MKTGGEPPIPQPRFAFTDSEQKAEAESRIAQLEQHFLLEQSSKLGDIAEVGEAVTNQRPISLQF